MKIEITQPNAFDAEGEEIAVGTVLEHDGDTIPAFLVGKAVVLNVEPVAKAKSGKTLVTGDTEGE